MKGCLERWYQYGYRSKKLGLKCCSFEEFERFFVLEKKCVYCNIPEEKIKEIYPRLKVKSMTVDRKDNLLGYEIENICWACLVCNVIKGFLLSHEEMLEIGQKYVRPRWENNIVFEHRLPLDNIIYGIKKCKGCQCEMINPPKNKEYCSSACNAKNKKR